MILVGAQREDTQLSDILISVTVVLGFFFQFIVLKMFTYYNTKITSMNNLSHMFEFRWLI